MAALLKTSRRVFVAGHRGMLGSMVRRVFQRAGWDVIVSPCRFGGSEQSKLLRAVRDADCDVVVNCLGLTDGTAPPQRLWKANVLWPLFLRRETPKAYLIHASTNGVFSGIRGAYRVEDCPDAVDPYGLSKRVGEFLVQSSSSKVTILRASIIGPARRGHGLLAWYCSQRVAVLGYTDQQWNGVTTLTWAEEALQLARQPPTERPAGLQHLATRRTISKGHLLECIRLTPGLGGPPVTLVPSGHPSSRTLRPTLFAPLITQQLDALRDWLRR